MKRSLVQRLKHNAHFLTLLLAFANGFAYAIPGDSWWKHTTALGMTVAAFGLILFHKRNHCHGPCPGCPGWTERQLRSLPIRFFASLSKIIPWMAITLIPASLVITALRPAETEDKPESFSLASALFVSAFLVSMAVLALSVIFRGTYPSHYPMKKTRLLMWMDRVLRKAGHRVSHIMTAGVLLLIPLVIFTEDSGVWASIRTILVIGMFGAMLGEQRHADSLCEECAANLRTDAPEYAERRKVIFKITHRHSRAISIGMYALCGAWLFLDQDIANLLMPVFYGTATAVGWMWRFHGRYSPWCPWCRDDGGGGEHEETPDPTPSHGRPVPV